MNVGEHFIRELKQINLLQKRLDSVLDDDIPTEQKTTQIIDHIESVNSFAMEFTDNVSSRKIKLTKDFLTTLNHELKTPLVPIRAYSEMLLQGRFGKLNQEQKKRLELLVLSTQQLRNKVESICNDLRNDYNKSESSDEHKIRELEQEKVALEKITTLLDSKVSAESLKIKDLKKKLDKSEHQNKEFEQEKLILSKTLNVEEKKNILLAKKNLIVMTIAAVIVGVGFAAYSIYVVELVGQQYRISNLGNIQSGYVIQNLRGDTIDTFLSWRMIPGTALTIKITNAEKYPEKIPLIKEVVLSDESIEIDDSLLHKGPKGQVSTYYVGWAGALKEASKKQTELYIPSNMQVIESSNGEGHINIVLSDLKSGDGYTGYAISIADESKNQILKSTITIFDVGNLGDDQFKAILRHEFGHALGLAHSTAPEDLMYPVIMTDYPYISDCNINAIVKLYDGEKNSQVTCEK
jgi:hypothetical protein